MRLKAVVKVVSGGLLILGAVSGTALAQGYWVTVGAPEVDPGTMGSAIALLTGGYLIISSRWRSK
jgi:hypothetical protein